MANKCTNARGSVTKENKSIGIASKKDSRGIFTLYLVNKVATSAFVDVGAMCSFISLQLVQENQWAIKPCEGTICQAMSGSEMSRIGQVVKVELRNGSRIVTTTMEVANLLGRCKVIIVGSRHPYCHPWTVIHSKQWYFTTLISCRIRNNFRVIFILQLENKNI